MTPRSASQLLLESLELHRCRTSFISFSMSKSSWAAAGRRRTGFRVGLQGCASGIFRMDIEMDSHFLQLASSFFFLAACFAPAPGLGAMVLHDSNWKPPTKRVHGKLRGQGTELVYVEELRSCQDSLRKGYVKANIFSHILTHISRLAVPREGFSHNFTFFSHPVPFDTSGSTSPRAPNLTEFHVNFTHRSGSHVKFTLCVSTWLGF